MWLGRKFLFSFWKGPPARRVVMEIEVDPQADTVFALTGHTHVRATDMGKVEKRNKGDLVLRVHNAREWGSSR